MRMHERRSATHVENPLLVYHLERDGVGLTDEDAQRLHRYEWPGNFRELQNVIEQAVILSKGDCLRLDLALANAPAVTVSSASDDPHVTSARAENQPGPPLTSR